MHDFLNYLVKLIFSVLLTSLILFVVSFSLVTGEFPPKMSSIRNGITNLQKNALALRQNQEYRLNQILDMTNKIDSSPDQSQQAGSNLETPNKLEMDANLLSRTAEENQILRQKIYDLETRVNRLEVLLLKNNTKRRTH